ncbi:MAG: hypothetical protein WAO55_03425 [Candidatus Manganitrophaceae bacterium]
MVVVILGPRQDEAARGFVVVPAVAIGVFVHREQPAVVGVEAGVAVEQGVAGERPGASSWRGGVCGQA